MKRHSGRGVAAVYGVAVVALASSPIPGTPLIRSARADTDEGSAACTVASLRGGYVVSVNGFVTLNGQGDTSPNGTVSEFTPVMEIGTFAFDGAGTVSRAVTVSVGGIPFPVNDIGTYVTNADCSGSIALSANSDTFNFNVVDEDSIAIVPMKLGQSGAGTLTRQRIRDCSAETFRGTYVFSVNGLGTGLPVPPPPPTDGFFPVSVIGTWDFDGKGGVTRSLSLSFDGYPFPYADTGTYQVNSNCTLSAYFSSDTEAFQIIAIDANRLVEGVVTAGRVGAGTLVRQRR
jgi:hypothetical protein